MSISMQGRPLTKSIGYNVHEMCTVKCPLNLHGALFIKYSLCNVHKIYTVLRP